MWFENEPGSIPNACSLPVRPLWKTPKQYPPPNDSYLNSVLVTMDQISICYITKIICKWRCSRFLWFQWSPLPWSTPRSAGRPAPPWCQAACWRPGQTRDPVTPQRTNGHYTHTAHRNSYGSSTSCFPERLPLHDRSRQLWPPTPLIWMIESDRDIIDFRLRSLFVIPSYFFVH